MFGSLQFSPLKTSFVRETYKLKIILEVPLNTSPWFSKWLMIRYGYPTSVDLGILYLWHCHIHASKFALGASQRRSTVGSINGTTWVCCITFELWNVKITMHMP